MTLVSLNASLCNGLGARYPPVAHSTDFLHCSPPQSCIVAFLLNTVAIVSSKHMLTRLANSNVKIASSAGT